MSISSNSVPLAEAKNKLSELIDRVSHGEEFIITRHDTEIARLVPFSRPSHKNVEDAIAAMRGGRKKRNVSVAEIIGWKNEGRR